jgi:hypothetical protein
MDYTIIYYAQLLFNKFFYNHNNNDNTNNTYFINEDIETGFKSLTILINK